MHILDFIRSISLEFIYFYVKCVGLIFSDKSQDSIFFFETTGSFQLLLILVLGEK